jgi:PAS domain S-box-containing protein
MNSPFPILDPHSLDSLSVLNSLADGVYITDLSRRIVFWNRAAERITGWTSSKVLGRSCRDNLLVHVDKDGHPLCGEEYCPLHRAIVTATPSAKPLLVFARAENGQRLPVEVSVAPLRDIDGRVIGGIEVFRNATDLMADLWRARVIQQGILGLKPPTEPRLQISVRYAPEEVVGGDFYHVEALDADRYAIMLADVMGHGVAAALYCMQLRAMWNDLRQDLPHPATFLARLNARLHALTRDQGYFATAVCMVVNARTGELRYVRAGGPSPLLLRSDRTFRWLDAHSVAIGLTPDAAFREKEDQIQPGDSLLFFTDGAVEVLNSEQVELGERGLANIALATIQPDGTLDLGEIEQALIRFSGRIRLEDDLTLLALRWQPWAFGRQPAAPLAETP